MIGNRAAAQAELVALQLQRSRLSRRIAEVEALLNPRNRQIAECGTDSGYYRHIRTLGETACIACRNAHADAERVRWERRRDAAAELEAAEHAVA